MGDNGGCVEWKRSLAARTSSRCSSAHCRTAAKGSANDLPKSVSEYSTVTGIVGYIVRSTMPSHSNDRSVCVSILAEIPGIARRNWLNRRGDCASFPIISAVHLSAMRSRIDRQGHNCEYTSGFPEHESVSIGNYGYPINLPEHDSYQAVSVHTPGYPAVTGSLGGT